jgi:hypothetical protein
MAFRRGALTMPLLRGAFAAADDELPTDVEPSTSTRIVLSPSRHAVAVGEYFMLLPLT